MATARKTLKAPRPMTEADSEPAARADPDAHPFTEADFQCLERTPQTKIIRRALGLTQEELATRYHLPLGALRDWERAARNPINRPVLPSR